MVDKKKISILFICRGPFGFLGGAASYMFPQKLTEMGHKVHVISFADTHGKTDKVYASQKKQIHFNEYWEPSLFQKIKILKDHIVQHKPDIVHVFRIQKYYLLPIFCKAKGVATPKWLIDIRSPPINPNFPKDILLLKIKRQLRVFQQVGFDVITSPVLSSAHETFSIVLKPVYEVPFGVDLSNIERKKWGPTIDKKKTIKFVYVGSLSKQRKIETLIKAIALCKKHSLKNFQVDIFGVGNFVNTMELMIKEMDLENTVHYRGVIPQPELFTRLTEYDVGIGYVPYEQYMGSPALKVLEYMAANLLVIASDTEGIKKQITHNINGILFQNTPESIARTILDVIENGWSLEVIEAGYDYALKNSWEAVVRDNLLEVYNKLLSGTV